MLFESGYESLLRENGIRFVDLNRDELAPVNLSAEYSGLKRLWLPTTILRADFLVSMPKVKTHHWSGVTLSMKNMFGVVPGNKYGWPKNILHWHGIHESTLDLCATIPVHFVIADAIMCMEGNGPLNGSPRQLGLRCSRKRSGSRRCDVRQADGAGTGPGRSHQRSREICRKLVGESGRPSG